MRPWQFSKPKNPGFGISQGFYLSVLCSKAVLPSIAEVVNPGGEGGAAAGFGAPLTRDTDKAALRRPLERGAYAVATKDRKTVLRMLVLGYEEAGYDPEAFGRSRLAIGADPELLARMRGTWNLAQFSFETHDAMVYPALDFLLGVTARLAMLAEGVVADPLAQRYRLPHETFRADRLDPRIDARDHIAVHSRPDAAGEQVYTLGMRKFNLPEYEIFGVVPDDLELAGRFLIALSQRVLTGDLTKPGERFGAPKAQLEAREGGLDRALWEGVPVFELLPPTGSTVSDCLHAWQKVAGA